MSLRASGREIRRCTEGETDGTRERQTLALYEQVVKRRCLKEREIEEIVILFIMGCSSA